MLTTREILCAILLPAVVAALIAAVGFWRRWAWTMPAAVGVGFLAAYVALSGVPKLPPRDGTDWLFWAAIPLVVLGIVDALTSPGWGWLLGAAAGGVALLIVRPLVPGTVSMASLCGVTLLLAAAGAALCYGVRFAEPRLGSPAIVGALCIVLGGTGVLVFSSNLRIGGVYGIAAAAALGPVALLSTRTRGARSVAIVAIPLLAGILVGGHYYPDPGVAWTNVIVLMAAPAILVLGGMVPGKRNWVRGFVAIVAIAVVVAAVTVPAARAAKKAAEADPYGGT
jgi:hypothetical protein